MALEQPAQATAAGGAPAVRVRKKLITAEGLASIALAVLLVAAAQTASSYGLVSDLILPKPSTVAAVLIEGFASGYYVEHTVSTVTSLLSGFVAASLFAIALAGVLSAIPALERILTPFLVAFQSLPKIALAPLIIIWFGFGAPAKIVIVATSCFFPVLINALQGLKIRERDRYELLRSLGATRWQMFVHLRLPDALPYIFAGLHVGAIFALIGSVVAEFVGSGQGIGYAMLAAKAQFDVAGVYACLIILMVLGIMLHALMAWLERHIAFWVEDLSTVTA
jgi:NitT/TauT family transport system permease protein